MSDEQEMESVEMPAWVAKHWRRIHAMGAEGFISGKTPEDGTVKDCFKSFGLDALENIGPSTDEKKKAARERFAEWAYAIGMMNHFSDHYMKAEQWSVALAEAGISGGLAEALKKALEQQVGKG